MEVRGLVKRLIRSGPRLAGLLPLLLPVVTDAAGAASCPAPAGAVTISVQPLDPGLTYDVSRSETELGPLNPRTLPPGVHLRGLTVEHLKSRLDMKFYQVRVAGDWCVMPTAIIAKIGFTSMTVYIDRKYPKGSCQRRAVVYHENKHVTINYEEMNAGLARIDADLRAALAAAAVPVEVARPDIGEKYLSDYFSYSFKRDFQEIVERMETRNTALDNPQEYAAVTALCPVW
jgi:hypothetical protein